MKTRFTFTRTRWLLIATLCAGITLPLQADPVTGVTLSHPLVVLQEGQTGTQLAATVAPITAANKDVSWESSDTSVATVDDAGWIHPVAEGEAVVTVTTAEGSFEASTPVHVRSGWTQFTLAPGSSIYYVSSSEGDDNNDGLSTETPVATVFKGLSLIKGGDWLLLKRGDTFNEGIHYWENGLSEDYKTVIGAYGDETLPRPLLDPQGKEGMKLEGGSLDAPRQRPDELRHVAFVSLHFYQSKHEPGALGFSASGGSFAMSLLRPGRDVLFEDIRWDWFRNARIQGTNDARLYDLTIRRCAMLNNFGGRSQGFFINWVNGVLIEECVFDLNGFNEEADVLPTIFNHNLYLQYDNSADMIVRRNITARAAATGLQQRPGGVCEQNVFIENPIAGFVAGGAVSPQNGVQILNDNVVIDAATWVLYDESNPPSAQGTRGWGLMLNHGDGDLLPQVAEMQGNIVAHAANGIRPYEVVGPLQSMAKVSKNITYKWGASPNSTGPFPDPERTVKTYNASLGGPATNDAFLTAAAEQRKGEWSSAYTWEGIWNYIREGFGVTAVHWRPVTALSLDANALEIPVNTSELLKASVTPSYASQTLVGWMSSNPDVAEVTSSGRVIGQSPGVTTITAVSTDGGFTATTEVTVTGGSESFASAIGAPLVDGETDLYLSDWFGYFYEIPTWDNWAYHTGFGWINTSSVTGSDSVWLWSNELEAWLYTTSTFFPWIWGQQNPDSSVVWIKDFGDSWFYYALTEDQEAWLYHATQDSWFKIAQ